MSTTLTESRQIVRPFVLASRSPRRLKLLRQIGIEPIVQPCDIPEDFDPAKRPEENAHFLGLEKARAVSATVSDGIVLGADTIVAVDGVMLGKPIDKDDAVRMLTLLAGRSHQVHTGYALIDCPSGNTISGVESTTVTFRLLAHDEIVAYVEGGSPMDKAGAYGIQDDYGAVFVRRIEGCYYNVVGLPLQAVHQAVCSLRAQGAGLQGESK